MAHCGFQKQAKSYNTHQSFEQSWPRTTTRTPANSILGGKVKGGRGKEGVLPRRRAECSLLGWVGAERLTPAILLAYLLQNLVEGGEGGEVTVGT